MDLDSILEIDNNNNMPNKIVETNLEKRILVLNREIDEKIIENYILYILEWNAQDKYIPEDKRTPIRIFVNCLGGNVIDGFNFVDIIESSKTKIIGVCFGMAASMGYHIYLACHERIAFRNSILLQHDGEIAIQNSSSKAKDTMKFFDTIEARTKEHVLSKTHMTEEKYDKIYDQEYYMYADEAKELGCVDRIIGVDCDIDEIL